MTVEVGEDDPGDDVTFLLAANPGLAALPLAKAASGGELARAMLALRLVLTAAPPILVFDEVDAGIGGQAALVVGRALAALGGDHQVLVVTHLPQVAAFADAQVAVTKVQKAGATSARAAALGPEERIVELSRMLSGTPQERECPRARQRIARDRIPDPRSLMARSMEGRPRRYHRRCQGRPEDQGSRQTNRAGRDRGDRSRGPRPRGGRDADRGERRCDHQRIGIHLGAIPEHGTVAPGRGGHPRARQRRLRCHETGDRRRRRHACGEEVRLGGETIATGSRQSIASLEVTLDEARRTMGGELAGSPRTRSPTSKRRATCSSTTRTSPMSRLSSRVVTS